MFSSSIKRSLFFITFCLLSSLVFGQSSIISAGFNHTLFICRHGDVWATGTNSNGQLGDGTTTDRNVPVKVKNLSHVIAVACGGHHSLALRKDSTVWAWGPGGSGELGDSAKTDRYLPVRVWALKSIIAIAAGDGFSMALDKNGKVWVWGYNGWGQMGDGTTTNESYPIIVSDLSTYKMIGIGAGYNHALAMKNDSTVYAWGLNSNGQLGQGTGTVPKRPVLVQKFTKAIMVDGAWQHTIILRNDSTAWAIGGAWLGQLGYGGTTQQSYPAQVTGLKKLIAAGGGQAWDHGIALGANGLVYDWGHNGYGELGDSTTSQQNSPVQGKHLDNVIAVNAGQYFNVAIKKDGTVWAWGNNGSGELGDSTTTNRRTPVKMKFYDIAAHLCSAYSAFSTSSQNTCSGSTVSFTNKSTGQGALSYKWKINGKMISTAQDTSWYFGALGNYTITLLATDSNCTDSSSLTVSISNPMDSLSLPYTNVSCSGVPVGIKAVAAKLGKYDLSLNGSGAWAQASYDSVQSPLKHLSIEAWYRAASLSSLPQFVVSKGTDDFGNGHWSLFVNRDSTIFFKIYKNGQYGAQSKTHIVAGAWYHFCGTWDGDTMRLYINGKFESKISCIGPITDNKQGVQFGRLKLSGNYQYLVNGEIDEVRLWDSTRTAAEVSSYYKTVLPSTTKGIIGYWRFDEGSGSTGHDDGPRHVNASLYNSASWSVSTAPLYPYITWKPAAYLSDTTGDTVVANPLANIIYHVQATNLITGCSNSDSVSFKVKSLPYVNAGADKSICVGDSQIIGTTALSGNIYSWKSIPSGFISTISNPKVSPTNSTIYIVNQTNIATGCSNSDSVYVNTKPLPTAAVGNPSTICDGNPISIGSTFISGNTYSWTSKPPGFTSSYSNPTVSPTKTSVYKLTEVNTSTGCSKTDSVKITVDQLSFDSITGKKNICIGDSVLLTANVKVNSKYDHKFDGINDYDSVPSNSNLQLSNALTISFWIKITASKGHHVIVKGNNTTNEYSITIDTLTNKINFNKQGVKNIVKSNTSLKLNSWYHIAITYNYPDASIYINGALDNTGSYSGKLGTASSPITIGDFPLTKTNIFALQGSLDDLSIWNYALTKSQIQAIISGNIPSSSTGLQAYWDFNEGAGNYATDKVSSLRAYMQKGTLWDSSAALIYPGITWSPSSAINNNLINSIWVKPLSTTTYKATATNGAAGCSKTDSIIITVDQLPSVSVSSPTSICNGSSTLIGASSVSGIVYNWTSKPLGFTYSGSNPSVSPAKSTTYYLNEKDTMTGCVSSDSVNIYVNPLPLTTIDLIGNDTLCGTDSSMVIGHRNLSGYALDMDGSNDTVSVISHNLNVFPITVSCWVKTTQSALDIGLVNKYRAGSINGYQLYTYNGHIYAWYMKDKSNYVFAGTGSGLDGGAIDNGKWHFVAFTVDSAGGRLYVDGSLNASRSWTGTPGACSSPLCVRFGDYPGSLVKKGTFKGQLDEVRIWNRAFTAKELATSANTAISGTTKNLIAYWTFDEGRGILAHDYSGNGNEGTLANFALTGTFSNWVSATNGVKVAKYSWTASNGKKIISDTFYVKPATTTTYYHTGTTISSGCTSIDSITIVASTMPRAFAGVSDSICMGDSINLGSIPISGNSYKWTSIPSGFTSNISNPIVHPIVTTTYFITEVNALGCSKTDSVKVTVDPPANAGINASVCKGGSVIFGGKSLPGYSYSWISKPSGFTSSTYSITVTPSNTTTYYLSQTSALGCKSADSVTVTVNPLPSTIVGVSQAICSGYNVKLGTSAVSGHTYSWTSKPVGFTSTTSNPNVSPVKTTMYYLTEKTTATGCAKSDTVTITVNPLPSANAGTNSTICLGDSASIGGNSLSGNTYSWTSKPFGYSSSNSSNKIAPKNTTTYFLKETITATGCFKQDSVMVKVNPKPASKFLVSGKCLGSNTQFNDSSLNDVKQIWYFGDGSTSSNKNSTHLYARSGAFTVSLSILNSYGCGDSSVRNIFIDSFAGNAKWLAKDLCDRKFSFQAEDTAFSKSVYSWDFGDGKTTTGYRSTHSYLSDKSYLVHLFITNSSGCSISNDSLITVVPPPVAFAGNDVAICYGDSIRLGAKPVSGNSYSWSSYPSGFVSFNSDPFVAPLNTITYFLIEKVISNGCSKSDSVKITVNTNPIAKFNADKVCQGDAMKFIDSSSIHNTQRWGFGDGNIDLSENPSHYYKKSGTYNASLAIRNLSGCSDSVIMLVVVKPRPSAQWTAEKGIGNLVVIRASDTTIISRIWKINNEEFNDSIKISYKFPNSGSFPVSLTVINKESCSAAYDSVITISGDNNLNLRFYPNPFQEHAFLSYTLQNPSKVKIVIYDMPGNEIKIIADESQSAGYYSYKVNAPIDNLISSATYLLKVIVNDNVYPIKFISIH